MSSKSAAHKHTIQKLSNILKNVGVNRGTKSSKQLERHLKGVANHHRIEILMLIAEREGLTLEQISDALKTNLKTTSAHTTRLQQAGLLQKKYLGRNVMHTLSPYGYIFYSFLKTF